MPTIKGGIKISKGKLVKGNLPIILPFKATGWKSDNMPEGIEIEKTEEVIKSVKVDVKTVKPKARKKTKLTSKARKRK